MNLQAYIAAIPKAELHLHFEGAIQPEDRTKLASKNRISLSKNYTAGTGHDHAYKGFDEFKNVLLEGVRVIREPEDLHYLMLQLGSRLHSQNVRYAEISWTPQLYKHLPFTYSELFAALTCAATEIRDGTGLQIRWIPDLVRNRPQFAREVMEWATRDESRNDGVVALGLAGPELSPLNPFIGIFQEAMQRGLPANPHAGEGTRPDNVREIIEFLKPRRIGHGVSAIEDPRVIDRLIAENITLEVCPTSNVRLCLYPDYAAHPLKRLIDSGCKVTLNTDDPAIFKTNLCDEYLHAVRDCGLTREQLRQTIMDAVTSTYLPVDTRHAMLTEFEHQFAAVESMLANMPATVSNSGTIASSISGHEIKTNLNTEREVQARWKLKPRHAGTGIFDQLVSNEFAEPEIIAQQQTQALKSLLDYAQRRVPYYRNLFDKLNLRPDDINRLGDLSLLPPVTKNLVRENEKQLQSRNLPAGESLFGTVKSSGTTGRPVQVLQTQRNNLMFHVLNQRHYRWYRLEPDRTLAFIRLAGQLPMMEGGRPCTDGETVRLPDWRYVGSFFQTGPWLGYNITNPIEQQLTWLQRERPDYLGSYAESLEHLCFASTGKSPADSIRAIIAVSEQLTKSMRNKIVTGFNAPVHQGYGLSEIGLVAIECNAGRFHVHAEHCIVELVDAEGLPSLPGTQGRILVTALNNYAMPLIRYDTDDLAMSVDGPCPCGRTLPSFGAISGRYSRIAYLPENTLDHVAIIRTAIDTMPDKIAAGFRRYQLHQFRDGHYELRLVVAGEPGKPLLEYLRNAWRRGTRSPGPELIIRQVEDIPRTAGGKNQEFTSDFMPAPD